MNDPIVRVSDVRSHRYCNKGTRKLAKRLGLDWNEFITNGIPISKLEGIQHPLIEEVVKYVKDRIK